MPIYHYVLLANDDTCNHNLSNLRGGGVSTIFPGTYVPRYLAIPKSAGAKTQPCLTPLRISKGLEELPLTCAVIFVSVWKDSIMLCSLGGQPIFGITLKRPSLLTRSNALVRSMKAMYKRICCSLHFSRNCRREKIMYIVTVQHGSHIVTPGR